MQPKPGFLPGITTGSRLEPSCTNWLYPGHLLRESRWPGWRICFCCSSCSSWCALPLCSGILFAWIRPSCSGCRSVRLYRNLASLTQAQLSATILSLGRFKIFLRPAPGCSGFDPPAEPPVSSGNGESASGQENNAAERQEGKVAYSVLSMSGSGRMRMPIRSPINEITAERPDYFTTFRHSSPDRFGSPDGPSAGRSSRWICRLTVASILVHHQSAGCIQDLYPLQKSQDINGQEAVTRRIGEDPGSRMPMGSSTPTVIWWVP